MITGSNGYIGTNFIKLYKDKYHIITVDKKVDENNVLKQPPFIFHSIDHVVHLAAISGIQQCENDISTTIEDNIFTTLFIVNNLRNVPITFASSQAAKDPNNKYALTKRISEDYIKKYAMRYTILRFANVYGGNNYLTSKTSVVAKFINAYKAGESLVINGYGDQERDFIHVNDICKAIDLSIGKPINDTVDIGTGIGTSIRCLAEMISDKISSIIDSNAIGIQSNIADVSEARKLLGFKSQCNLKDYIDNTLNEK